MPRAAQVIGGWTEAMQLMVEGDKWEMYIPANLAYGDGGGGRPAGCLVFTMEILKIKGGSKPKVKKDEQPRYQPAGGAAVGPEARHTVRTAGDPPPACVWSFGMDWL